MSEAAAAAIERLRERLVDRTANNRLLNFRQGANVSGVPSILKVVGEPLNRLFARLQEQKPLTFEPVPVPSEREIRAFYRGSGAISLGESEDERSRTRPDAARWAEQQGWDVSYELPTERDASADGRPSGDAALRVLLYPDQLEARLRRLRSNARLAMEESGSNLLFMVFGFLQWGDRPWQTEFEDRPPFQAPLVLLPATIDTRTNRRGVRSFTIAGTGEDRQPNLALQRKLAVDFGIDLPDFAEDDTPEAYFHRVRQAVAGQDSWRISRSVTLMLLTDVGKSLLHRDLDPARWPDGAKPADHPIVRSLVGDANQPHDRSEAERDDAAIARTVDLDLCLVDRADETQAHALLKALGGDNLVIQGPPGTGKSQTIANLIAAALERDKTVLFVAAKLAALEVVKRRLREARLGEFCLELHSRKTRQKVFFEDLKERIAKRAHEDPAGIDDALSALAARRSELDSYVSVIRKPAGRTGRTIADLLFEAGRVRAEDETLARDLDIASVPERVGVVLDTLAIDKYSDHETTRVLDRIAHAASALDPVGGPLGCPWRGVENQALAIEAQTAIHALAAWRDKASAAAQAIQDLNTEARITLTSEMVTFEQLRGLSDGRVDLPKLFTIAAELSNELKGLADDFYLPLAGGLAGLRDALRVLKLVAAAPEGQLRYSHLGLDSPAGSAALDRLAEKLQRRADILDALNGRIETPVATGLDDEALRTAGRLLIEARFFARMGRNWREARRLARALAPPGVSATAKDRGEALLLLAERAAIDLEIAGDPDIREACGSHFRGASTDVDGLKRAREWRQAVDAEFGARRERGFREALLAAGRGEIIKIKERVSGSVARLGAFVSDITGEHEPPSLSDFWVAITRELAPGILADALSKREDEASVADFVRCVITAAEAGRDLQQAQRHALETLQADSMTWFGSRTDISAEQMADRADAAVKHPEGLDLWLGYARARREISQPGTVPLVEAMEGGVFDADRIGQAWRIAWLTHAVRRLHASEPVLLRFNGAHLDDVRKEYVRLDSAVMELRRRAIAARLMQRRPPEGVRGPRACDMTELALLAQCTTMERGHPSIGDVMARAGRALQAIKPCFVMGPLSVSQYLTPGVLDFDLVILDEASQIRPEDALGAVARGSQLVVVGDDRQLPPTSFLDRIAASIEPSDNAAADGAPADQDDKSLLALASACFRADPGMLRWHYRSRTPELIAFSNGQFYNNELVFFPAPEHGNSVTGLTHILVRQGCASNGINDAEARRIAQSAVDRLRARPDQSLMVAAMNIQQKELIETHIARLEVTSRGLAEVLEESEAEARIEPFVVKTLENVQGDERDVVMVSMTYGPHEPGGVVPQEFGTISEDRGDRRLNVLFTRAREQLVIFTSMRSSDIQAGPKGNLGPHALNRFLRFAETKELPGAARLTGKAPESSFEEAMVRELARAGYNAEPQLGAGAYRIDVAVRNPDSPEQFLLGIQCDGAMYHSTLSARDRERLSQEVLENLGWELERVWSVDWFRDPRAEIKRIRDRLEYLRERQRQEDSAVRIVGRAGEEVVPLFQERAAQSGPRFPRGLTREETRTALVVLRERIEREFPDADPARGLLRQSMIEELLRRRPTGTTEWTAKIPAELRQATDSVQLNKYGREIFNVLEGIAAVPAL